VTSNYRKVYQYYCDIKILNNSNKFAIILVEVAIILVEEPHILQFLRDLKLENRLKICELVSRALCWLYQLTQSRKLEKMTVFFKN